MKFYERAEVKDVLAYLRLAARPGGRSRVPARRQRSRARHRRGDARPARGARRRETGGPGGRSRRTAAGLPERARDGARAIPRDRRRTCTRRRRPGRPRRCSSTCSRPPATPRSTTTPRTARTWRGARTSQELLSSAREFERRNAEGATIAEYLDTVSLATDARRRRARAGAVTLSTLHAAKGLEFASSSSSASRRGTCRTASPPRTRTSSRRSGGCSTSA